MLVAADRSLRHHCGMLRSANVFRVRSLDPATREPALRFVESWSFDDVYDRFGSVGIGGREWLTAELSKRSRPALIAVQDGEVLGLLDYTCAQGALHIGIVVDSRFRKSSIGKTLVSSFVEARTPTLPVAAECDAGNRAAVALLAACGFERAGAGPYEICWRYE